MKIELERSSIMKFELTKNQAEEIIDCLYIISDDCKSNLDDKQADKYSKIHDKLCKQLSEQLL